MERKALDQKALNAIAPMEGPDFLFWQERMAVAAFCNCSQMELDKMPATDYALWRERTIAYAKRKAQAESETRLLLGDGRRMAAVN